MALTQFSGQLEFAYAIRSGAGAVAVDVVVVVVVVEFSLLLPISLPLLTLSLTVVALAGRSERNECPIQSVSECRSQKVPDVRCARGGNL